jgi:hypothetical protein
VKRRYQCRIHFVEQVPPVKGMYSIENVVLVHLQTIYNIPLNPGCGERNMEHKSVKSYTGVAVAVKAMIGTSL